MLQAEEPGTFLSMRELLRKVEEQGFHFKAANKIGAIRECLKRHTLNVAKKGGEEKLLWRMPANGRGMEVALLAEMTCQGCGRADDEESMPLCDGCNRGWHIYCLPKKLKQIPSGKWYCPACTEINAAAGAEKDKARSLRPLRGEVGDEGGGDGGLLDAW